MKLRGWIDSSSTAKPLLVSASTTSKPVEDVCLFRMVLFVFVPGRRVNLLRSENFDIGVPGFLGISGLVKYDCETFC